MKILILVSALLIVSACSEQEAPQKTLQKVIENTQETPIVQPTILTLDSVLAEQPEEVQARYQYRNPKETLEFFGLQPGMTVAEALPGGGWYSKILSPYIGPKGKLIGVDYSFDIWPNFSFVDDEFLAKRKTWSQDWPKEATEWNNGNGAKISAYTFATIPEDVSESVDVVLFIRALHNLNRFEEKGNYITQALKESFRILKPGGVVGVVQHQVADDKSDEWASGSRGYMKKNALKATFVKAGFAFVKESDINSNPKDQPAEEDIVWRLPPTYYNIKEDEELKAKMAEIGESNRMTLVFRKPDAE